MPESVPSNDAESYLRLLNAHERSLAAYVHGLVPSMADADDILQECKIVLWKQFAEFEPGTHFLAWARRIALNLILNHRRSLHRRAAAPIDEQFIRSVACEIDRNSDHLERRAEALRLCLEKLSKPHRQAVFWRYFEDCEIAEIASKSNRSEGATYRLLSRIRQILNDCVTKTVNAGTV
ncbi:MAG: sigma-70 family RNA polymerase sigma factor [Verrucomicrobiae bacterium]|jgi:RNA polymerase sigma-70 factor (ECF subfamily)|nr:sigma-70 family RNA polymerase sigma factor [Verrucomicrobiae bacterium]